jgi:hypothetical protein
MKHDTGPGGVEPLSPQRKWQTITIGTLVLLPGYWALLAALVADASDGTAESTADAPNVPAAFAFGLALIPFVFCVLAFMSQHPRAAGAVVKAMGMAILVGVPASAIAGDAVTGIVAGVGAGGIVALRADVAHSTKTRAIAVAIAAAYTFVLVRTVGPIALLPVAVFPLTGIGIADHLSERRQERAESRI